MRSLVIALVVAGLGLILFAGGCSSYNGFVDAEENVENAWSKVESAYQRRADLIPNLVNTVKGVADFEQKTLTEVVNARAKATSVNIDPSNITPEQLQNFQNAQSGLSQSLGRLLFVSENYPELKASANFRELQTQLESTENRIKVERDRFNDVATAYNKKVRRFPGNFFATMFGFAEKAQFQAQEGSENAPEVNFD
ncbi:MAG: LemA family protein [Bacteroidota bacterium]